MTRTVLSFLAIAVCFGIVGEMDYQDALDREQANTAWLKERCLDLKKGQKAVVTKQYNGDLQCAKYQGVNVLYAEVRK